MRYKIIYYVGTELDLKTRMNSGILTLQEGSFTISGSSVLTIPFSDLTRIEIFRHHGLGRMIKMLCKERNIFLTVPRLNLFGYFVIINFFSTGKLFKTLKEKTQTIELA